jgi:hypothetical protein
MLDKIRQLWESAENIDHFLDLVKEVFREVDDWFVAEWGIGWQKGDKFYFFKFKDGTFREVDLDTWISEKVWWEDRGQDEPLVALGRDVPPSETTPSPFPASREAPVDPYSSQLTCPSCQKKTSLWDAKKEVTKIAGEWAVRLVCPKCSHIIHVKRFTLSMPEKLQDIKFSKDKKMALMDALTYQMTRTIEGILIGDWILSHLVGKISHEDLIYQAMKFL